MNSKDLLGYLKLNPSLMTAFFLMCKMPQMGPHSAAGFLFVFSLLLFFPTFCPSNIYLQHKNTVSLYCFSLFHIFIQNTSMFLALTRARFPET